MKTHQHALWISRYLIPLFCISLTSCTPPALPPENTLHDYLRSRIHSLDPIYAHDLYSTEVTAQIYEGLYQYHYLKRPLTIIPALAKGMPKVSQDQLTHTIKIKRNIFFHDHSVFPKGEGREVTAHDFVYSIKRVADPKNKSNGYWVYKNRILGLDKWRKQRAHQEIDFDSPIPGLFAKDKYTLVIRLTKPYYQLHHILTMPYAYVVPREGVETLKNNFGRHPIGTGPFMFSKWTPAQKITLMKNPKWRQEHYPSQGEVNDHKEGLLQDSGQKLPFVDQLIFHIFLEDQPRWLNFAKGHLDHSGVPVDFWNQAIQKGQLSPLLQKRKVRLQVTNEPDLTYMSFNMEDPIVGKKKNSKFLRQAIALAMDNTTLVDKFYKGRALVAQGLIPPGMDGHQTHKKHPYKKQNLQKAKALLAQAGYPEGKGAPTFVYSTVNNTLLRQMAEFEKQNFARIGLKLKIEMSSWPQFTQKVKSKKAQIYSMAWYADFPDGENFLQLLYGPNQSPGSNGSNYNNSKFNLLYQKASILPPSPQRTHLYHQMTSIANEELPIIPQVHRLSYRMIYPWVYNFKYHRIIKNYRKYLRLDFKKRAELKNTFKEE